MDFYKRVAVVCNHIPYGKVATYGQIALLCGKPRNARQVGFALNHRVQKVPAYRVVNGQGYLSGAMAFETPDLQQMQLENEGVCVDENRHVNLKKYGWFHTMEEALSFRKAFEDTGI